jgi:LPXTG-motif cell wall-anchored protein
MSSIHGGTWSHTSLRVLASASCAAAVCLLSPAAALAADHGDHGASHGKGQAHAHQSGGHAGGGHATGGKHTSSHGSSVALHDKRYQAQADPDGEENGGVDQPGGEGGTIGAQDGNNGSGNDADCEDDNRGRGVPGHCRPHPGKGAEHRGHTPTPPNAGSEHEHGAPHRSSSRGVTESQPQTQAPSAGSTQPSTGAQGVAVTSPVSSTTSTTFAGAGARSGVRAPRAIVATASASPAHGLLPNTGAGAELAWYAVAGAVALGAGAVVTRRATR